MDNRVIPRIQQKYLHSTQHNMYTASVYNVKLTLIYATEK